MSAEIRFRQIKAQAASLGRHRLLDGNNIPTSVLFDILPQERKIPAIRLESKYLSGCSNFFRSQNRVVSNVGAQIRKNHSFFQKPLHKTDLIELPFSVVKEPASSAEVEICVQSLSHNFQFRRSTYGFVQRLEQIKPRNNSAEPTPEPKPQWMAACALLQMKKQFQLLTPLQARRGWRVFG